jgi:SAM-dependent methyltransferase
MLSFKRRDQETGMKQGSSLKTKIRRWLSKIKRDAYHVLQALRGFKAYHADVDLEKVFIGNQCGKVLEKWVKKTHEWDRASCLLKDSPYVRFLSEVAANEHLLNNDTFLENQPYYRMAETAVEFSGSFFGGKTPEALKKQMRSFYKFYSTFSAGHQGSVAHDDFRHSTPDDPVMMHKIFSSDCYELNDGHHRAAISYVMGKRKMNALIAGEAKTYLQKLLLRDQAGTGIVLHQPIEKPEVAGWAVRRGCEERMRLMKVFLTRTGQLDKIKTVLDLECGYGWFLHAFHKMGCEVTGISKNVTATAVSKIAFGLTAKQVHEGNSSVFLDSHNHRYDLVLFLNALDHFVSGDVSEEGIKMLQQIDGLTGKVLILGCGQDCDSSLSNNLPRSDYKHIKLLIREKTSFDHIITLGNGTDNQGKCREKNTEILFACIR